MELHETYNKRTINPVTMTMMMMTMTSLNQYQWQSWTKRSHFVLTVQSFLSEPYETQTKTDIPINSCIHSKLTYSGHTNTEKHQQMYQVIATVNYVPSCHRHLECDQYNPMTHTSIVPALGNTTCDLQSTHQQINVISSYKYHLPQQ